MKQLNAYAWASLTVLSLVCSPALAETPFPEGSTTEGNDWGAVVQAGYNMGVQFGVPAVGPEEKLGGVPLPGYGPVFPQNHPRPKAGLYPSPVQDTPPWHLQTVITNQALAPHEMLYPHEYHAMYGPFYYKMCGRFIWTPFGMRTHENWKLQGTEVKVKYSDRKPILSGWHPPRGFHAGCKL